MRGDASLNGDVLGYFEQGETVTILDAADGGGMNWLRVRRKTARLVGSLLPTAKKPNLLTLWSIS